MPAILIALVSALASAAGTIAGKVLIALGIQYVTYQGFELLLDQITAGVDSGIGGLPSAIIGYVGLFKIPAAVSVIVGAIIAKWTIAGLSSGSITRMVLK